MTPRAPAAAQGRPIDPAEVERELSALWMAEAEARQREGQARPLGRTLLHTLVAVARDRDSADAACQATAALYPRQPARTILVEALDDDPAETLEAWVTLQCTAAQNGRDYVCGEQVTLEARGAEAVGRLPGAVLPLLLTDVPSFLWWQTGSPFGQPFLRELGPVIDRLIVDSYSFPDAQAAIADIARAIADPHFAAIVSDLSWSRLAPWRYHTAQIFDATALRAYLPRLLDIRVRYYAGSPILAWLYAGWLASRLGWELESREAAGMRFAGGIAVRFEPLPVVDEMQPGFFAGARLEADDGAVFEVRRLGTTCAVTYQTMGELQTERVVPLRQESLTGWLGHELDRLGSVSTYEAAARLLALS